MLLMNNKNIIDIYHGDKTMTLRPLKKNNKGYFKLGSIQEIRNNHFSKDYHLKVQIIGRKFVNINNLSINDFHELGYASREEYLAEDYNQKNPSSQRICYRFRVVKVNKTKMLELLEKYNGE